MKKNVLLLFFLGAAVTLNAQKFKVTEGSLSSLQGVTAFNIQFTYDNMLVGKKQEAQYIAEKTAEYNKREAGRGDSWAKSWEDDRKNLFEPKFLELFNKHGKVSIVNEPQKYTLIFNTDYTEPGWNIGISRSNAYIGGEITVVETDNPSKVIAKISVTQAPGSTFMGVDYATGPRISEAYAITGKNLPAFLAKQMK